MRPDGVQWHNVLACGTGSVPSGCLSFAPSRGGGTPGPLHKQFCKGLSKATGFRENLKEVPVLITLAECLKSGGLISALFVLKSLKNLGEARLWASSEWEGTRFNLCLVAQEPQLKHN